MEIVEEQINIHVTSKETPILKSITKSHNPGLRALLSIKNFTATLEKDTAELQQIESDLDELNKTGLLLIEANTSPEKIVQWKLLLAEVSNAVTGINNIIASAKEMIEQKATNGYPELWQQLAVHLSALKDNANNAANTGLEILPGKWNL
jgi:hypothetical protein